MTKSEMKTDTGDDVVVEWQGRYGSGNPPRVSILMNGRTMATLLPTEAKKLASVLRDLCEDNGCV
jgi:hypothetical protein